MKSFIALALLFSASLSDAEECSKTALKYDRNHWGFESFSSTVTLGYYTQLSCDDVDIDHVVSLKDAHNSGGSSWDTQQKKVFANDRSNLVSSMRNGEPVKRLRHAIYIFKAV